MTITKIDPFYKKAALDSIVSDVKVVVECFSSFLASYEKVTQHTEDELLDIGLGSMEFEIGYMKDYFEIILRNIAIIECVDNNDVGRFSQIIDVEAKKNEVHRKAMGFDDQRFSQEEAEKEYKKHLGFTE